MRTRLLVLAWLGLLSVLVSGCANANPPLEAPATAATPAQAAAEVATPAPPVARASSALAASLALDPLPALQGGQVRLSGQGFGPTETVTISAASTADNGSPSVSLGSATTTASGALEDTPMILPQDLPSGAHPLHVIGQASGRRGTATLWIRAPEPWLVLSSYDIPQYGDVGLVAGGFEPMEQVQVSLEPRDGGSGAVALATLATDQAGNAPWTQTKLLRTAAGAYMIVLHGQAGGQELRREVQVSSLKPLVEPSPWAGPPGVSVQLNARGFAPSEQVRVGLGANAPLDTDASAQLLLNADEYGNVWAGGPLNIPQTTPTGPLTVSLFGVESGARASFEFKVLEPKPWLELTSWSGAPGSPVGFGGGGWIAGERVTFHLGQAGTPAQASANADPNGWLKAGDVVYVPLDAPEEVTFVAVGEQSHLVASATFKVVYPFGLRPGKTGAMP